MTDQAPDTAPNPPAWLSALAGRFLVFEGPDGSGKSTQFRRLHQLCEGAGVKVCEVREPGGTIIGERIRAILLDQSLDHMSLRCEMMLYMASRAQLVQERILPAIAARHLVLADRFVSSTYAYQGAAGGLPADEISAVAHVAIRDACPDLVIIFDVDEVTAARRTKGVEKGAKPNGKAPAASTLGLFDDRIEQRGDEFQRKVRQSYLDQARADPAHHLVIDAARGPEEVWSSLLAGLEARFAPRS
ncbi:MAG: dTMP kinase [Phycisphaerales bacterium]|nr:dTMP kinase [Phycisphaerales bacterium]